MHNEERMTGPRRVRITGTGSALPSRVITNAEVAAMLGEPLDALADDAGDIVERRWCAFDESTADLAEAAAHAALESAQLQPAQIDLLIVATDTPEFVTPSTAVVVQGRLAMSHAVAFDVNAGGAGFVAAVDLAWTYLRADMRFTRVLVVGVSAMSRYLDVHDHRTVCVVADGAGAVLLEAFESVPGKPMDGVLATALVTDGRRSHDMGIFAGGARTPITKAVLEAGLQNTLRVTAQFPGALDGQAWHALTSQVLTGAHATADEVQWLLWSQFANSAVDEGLHAAGIATDRVHNVRDRHGYTGAAGLPIALDDLARSGRLSDGALVLGVEHGVGLAMGAFALRWHTTARQAAE